MKYQGVIHMPHEGDVVDPEITWEHVSPTGRRYLAINVNGYATASWHAENHPFWAMNPGLRALISQHYQAETNGLNP